MPTAFISYTREDQAIAADLTRVLNEHSVVAWIDRIELRPGTGWVSEIAEAIAGADAFVAVVSPAWARSEACLQELEFAITHAKRLIPVVRRGFDGVGLPAVLRELSWITLDDAEDVRTAGQLVVDALSTDYEWTREHTRLLALATEWRDLGEDPSYLLRGSALRRAEEWLTRASASSHRSVPYLQTSFIVASRRRHGGWRARPRRKVGVFVSYRRDDSEASAGRLADALRRVVGRKRLFIDVADIAPGADFVSALNLALDGTGALVAVIGPSWLTAADEQGTRRLDDPNDLVRLEINSALARGIAVIPVLVDRSSMPSEAALPAPLRDLARRQAIRVNHDRFQRDLESLVAALPAGTLGWQRALRGGRRI